MSGKKEESVSPTDSLNRPTQLIPPDSPVRLRDSCGAGPRSSTEDSEADSASSPDNTANGTSVNGECSEADVLNCLTPTLQDNKLHKMLANVARQDKNYVGGEMLSETGGEGTSEANQTQTPVECLSPFWTKEFPDLSGGLGDHERAAGEKATTLRGGKRKSPMTLNLAEKRFFVINNERVVDDGGSLGKQSMSSSVSARASEGYRRYFHEGAVMELVPGNKPAMKLVEGTDGPDRGSAITEIPKQKAISPIERCWVESGFCAFLVLRYDDPENPQLETMKSPDLQKKLQELEKEHRSPSDEHFTPIVNIAREGSAAPQGEYTTTLYFTTDKYTYYVHVENRELTLKKFKSGDTSPSADPRNNKQFLDKVYPDHNCSQYVLPKTGDSKSARSVDEVDSSLDDSSRPKKKMKADRDDSLEAESPSADSADGLSNPSSSQLSSPEGSNVNPSKLKLLPSQATGNDSGVEAN